MTRRAVQKLVDVYVRRLRLDPNVTVHSLRVTATTTAREQGTDIIDLQDFAGHADPRDDAHLYKESGIGSRNHPLTC